jgi:nucleoside-diphosphate-sugar epimerase
MDLGAVGWTARLPRTGADVVFHLAQSRRYREFPLGADDMLRVNTTSTMALAEWARTHGVGRLVFASTGNVYRPSIARLKEDDPCQPGSMYAATKLAAEEILRQYGAFLEVVIVRLFSVYGPGQQGMLVPDMIDRVRQGVEIGLADDTGPRLTPLFIDDCVRILESLACGPVAPQVRVFNLAGDEVLSLRQMVEEIGRQLGRAPVFRAVAGPAPAVCGDNTAIAAISPRFTRFADGVGQMLRPGAGTTGG